MKGVCVAICFLLFLPGQLAAQDSTNWRIKYPRIDQYMAGYHTGFIFAHSEEVQNTSGATPRGIELVWARQRNDPAVWNLCGCSPIQGLQFSFYDYDTPILGQSWGLAYLLEPTYRLSKKSSFAFRSAAGLAYLNRPYDVQSNPTNQSYSIAVNAYLALGIGYWYQLSDHWRAGFHIQYQHISNGGLRLPNKGINWPTAGLSISYQPRPRPQQKFERTAFQKTEGIRWDATLFSVAKRVAGRADGSSDRYLVAGAGFQGARQVGRMNNLTLGTEISWDDALGRRLRESGSSLDPWRATVLVGHEFIFGRFLFSQRLGVYLYQAGNFFDPVLHRWGLAYRISNHWSAGVNLQAHRQVADYTDFRVSFSF